MVSHLFFYQLALFVLVWLFVMLHLTGSQPGVTIPPVPAQPKRKRSTEPKPFAGLTQKPHWVWCEQETGETVPAPPPRPELRPSTNRRPRTVDTSRHFCPHLNCEYRGWLGLGAICGRMVILMAVLGGSSTAPRATAFSRSITAPSSMASKPRWSGSCAC